MTKRSQVLHNLESLGTMVGHLKGMSDALEDDLYTERLILHAHGKAANVFDVAAAATAGAGYLEHVFEYGVPGITKGQTKFPIATDPKARLWMHKIDGTGGKQDISYSFRPALNINPDHTTASTGVPSKYLRKLSRRKHIFWNKAFVMETGASVRIKSNRGEKGFVFVPTPGDNEPRGFVLYPSKLKPAIHARPGRTTMNQFTNFWMTWWSGSGSQIMENTMRSAIEMDIERAEAAMQKAVVSTPMKSPATSNIITADAHGRIIAKKTFETPRKLVITK